MAHLIMIEPSASALEISETFLIRNESNTTFEDSSKGTAQFYPPKTTGDTVQVSVTPPTQMTIQRQAVKAAKPGSFKIDYPVRPGETRFDMHYTLPASDSVLGQGDGRRASHHGGDSGLGPTDGRRHQGSRRRAGRASPPV